MKSLRSLIISLAAVAILGMTGGQQAQAQPPDENPQIWAPAWTVKRGEGAPVRPTSSTSPAPQRGSEFDLLAYGNLVRLHKSGPADASLGQTVMYETTVEALESVADVIVTDYLPAGAELVKSEPKADVDGRKLTWNLGELRKGETRKIQYWVKYNQTGDMTSCTRISAVPYNCLVTRVGKPMLAIQKTGPTTALLGSDVTYNIVVTNTGNATAKNVVVTDTVPAELAHASGQKSIATQVGDLAPGQSKTIPVTFKAAQRGKPCNVAVADGDGVSEVKAEACTVIVKPGLEIAKTGTKDQFIGKTATYQITVTNVGDTTLNDVTVTDNAPEGTRFIDADGATMRGNEAVWKIASMKAGEKRNFNVKLTSAASGSRCNRVAATSADRLTASAEACTVWKGMAAILVEAVDTEDPILVGKSTTYVVTVTNQGNADDSNVKLTGVIPKGLKILGVSGPTQGTATGQTFNFAPYPVLKAKESIKFMIKVEGVETSDSRSRFSVSSDLIQESVDEIESTHVY